VPVDRETEINLPSSGDVVLEVETPRLSFDYRQFEVELIEMRTGQATCFAYQPILVQRDGVTTMRIPFGRMVALAGKYLVRIKNTRTGVDYSTTRLIVSRPYMGRLVAQVIALVLCAAGALGSLIWAVWLAGWMTQSA
jgi:hypothetical protein